MSNVYVTTYHGNVADQDPELLALIIGCACLLPPFSIPPAIGLAYLLQHWKTHADVKQTGVITSVGKVGLFHKTSEMNLQLSKFGSGGTSNVVKMSLHGDKDLIKKAEECEARGSMVNVTYDKYAFPKYFSKRQDGHSSRIVKDIKEISPVQAEQNKTPRPPR